MLEALKMDVRRAAFHGIRQDAVEEFDDRRVIDGCRERGGRHLLFLGLDELDFAFVLGFDALEDLAELRLGRFEDFLEDIADRELTRDDREDVVAGDELHVLDDTHIRRVGHRHRQRAAVALEREHEILERHLAGDQLRDLWIHRELGEIHSGHLVLPRQHLGQLGLGDEAELHQIVPDARTVLLLLLERLVELLLGDQPLTHEQIANTNSSGGRCGH